MERGEGSPQIGIGLIDGPVAVDHPDLARENVRGLAGPIGSRCANHSSFACIHGTFMAGILSGKRGSTAPAICPGCTLVVRPVFREGSGGEGRMPSATPTDVAEAIVECAAAGVRVLSVSAALSVQSARAERTMRLALDHARRRGIITVAAAGNQGTIGSSAITRHPWVLPVVATELEGRPLGNSNLGSSLGRLGLRAPGDRITSLGPQRKPLELGGTSAAAAIVTGTIGLLWSLFPAATAADMKMAVTGAHSRRRAGLVPPLLDAWEAHQIMATQHGR